METTGEMGLKPEAYEKDLAKARKLLTDKGCTWMQAAQESIEDITLDRFGIQFYSTLVLLDPQGKIVALDPRGKNLLDLLERLLGQKTPGQAGTAPGSTSVGK